MFKNEIVGSRLQLWLLTDKNKVKIIKGLVELRNFISHCLYLTIERDVYWSCSCHANGTGDKDFLRYQIDKKTSSILHIVKPQIPSNRQKYFMRLLFVYHIIICIIFQLHMLYKIKTYYQQFIWKLEFYLILRFLFKESLRDLRLYYGGPLVRPSLQPKK